MNTLLKVENVYYSPREVELFSKKKKHEAILNNITFEVNQGDVIGIVGESGSGKTTLIKVISGILKHEKGNIIFHQRSKNKSSNPIQILFQNTNELINPLRKVKDILNDSYESKNKLEEICRLLDIPNEQFDKIGYQLSGGERQRVGLARILSAEPELLILDEPFSAQDPESQKSFLDLFKKIKDELNITIICVSHDVKLLKQFASKIIVVFGGKIMEMGDAEKIINFYCHPYTKSLIEAFNYKLSRADFPEDTEIIIINNGCSYYSRCEKRSDKCIESIEEINSEGLTTYCNNPL